ncbi:hypothetical protein Bhyg_07305 [Pseudolycoriella hygida]|uniref:Uncharacterized protein n=1 Tax=Pseudolycoriella hygida TaxID=35572 RepID=A0A9Q0S1V7_9DIPT|nr:hypothetical protein Bhyg_07305 [Pseudolycoriella hygida]
MDVIFKILFLAAAVVLVFGDDTTNDTFINIPADPVFNDHSALSDKSNLQSAQYQDFIRNLYRFDKENLEKYDNLFQKAPESGT